MFKEKVLNLIEHNLNISFMDNENFSKKIILFVHGWSADKNNLKGIYSHLSDNYRIIAVDLPGFGSSSKPEKALTSLDYSSFLISFLKELKITKLCYAGHSFGGKIGIIISANHPELIEKLVLIDSAGIRSRRTLIWYLKVYSFKTMKFFIKNILRNEKALESLKSSFGSADYKNAGLLRETLVKVTSEDFSDLLPKIKCPVFLYWGENDKDTPLWMARKMKKLINDSALYIVKKGSHFSFLEDNRIIEIIKSFC